MPYTIWSFSVALFQGMVGKAMSTLCCQPFSVSAHKGVHVCLCDFNSKRFSAFSVAAHISKFRWDPRSEASIKTKSVTETLKVTRQTPVHWMLNDPRQLRVNISSRPRKLWQLWVKRPNDSIDGEMSQISFILSSVGIQSSMEVNTYYEQREVWCTCESVSTWQLHDEWFLASSHLMHGIDSMHKDDILEVLRGTFKILKFSLFAGLKSWKSLLRYWTHIETSWNARMVRHNQRLPKLQFSAIASGWDNRTPKNCRVINSWSASSRVSLSGSGCSELFSPFCTDCLLFGKQ